jgi:hypothetical protein
MVKAVIAITIIIGLSGCVPSPVIEQSNFSKTDSLEISAMKIEMFNLSCKIDSVQKANQALVKSVLYLDSCQQVKTMKSDRAERRGRFIAGLLKGLIPIPIK